MKPLDADHSGLNQNPHFVKNQNFLANYRRNTMSFKTHPSMSELSHALDRASNAMLGFSPEWSRNFLSSVASSDVAYPPYDIYKVDEDRYVIEIATAGFKRSELNIMVEKETLKITGEKTKDSDEEVKQKVFDILHKGIATRKFTRSFILADHVKVVDAKYEDGILSIYLEREVPEEEQPKQIPIL